LGGTTQPAFGFVILFLGLFRGEDKLNK